MKSLSKNIRKWSRILHKDISFFFAGMIMIYAISGLVMNHRNTINPYYDTKIEKFVINEIVPLQKGMANESSVKKVLSTLNEESNYTHFYYPEPGKMKVFLKGGSSLFINTDNGNAVYEKVNKRIIIGNMAKLHYNPQSWWTYFSDLFAVGLIIIVITGFTMLRGKQFLLSRASIEVLLGMVIPLCFLFFFS